MYLLHMCNHPGHQKDAELPKTSEPALSLSRLIPSWCSAQQIYSSLEWTQFLSVTVRLFSSLLSFQLLPAVGAVNSNRRLLGCFRPEVPPDPTQTQTCSIARLQQVHADTMKRNDQNCVNTLFILLLLKAKKKTINEIVFITRIPRHSYTTTR